MEFLILILNYHLLGYIIFLLHKDYYLLAIKQIEAQAIWNSGTITETKEMQQLRPKGYIRYFITLVIPVFLTFISVYFLCTNNNTKILKDTSKVILILVSLVYLISYFLFLSITNL